MAIEPVAWPAFSEWRQVLARTWKEAGDDNVGLLGAGVGFYLFLAFVPLLASVVLTYGLVAEPETVARHIETLARTLPQEAAAIIGDQLRAITGDRSAGKGIGLLLAIGIALYGASKGAASIVTALNIAYEVKETRGFVLRTALALAITAGMVAMLLVAAGTVSAVGFVERWLPFSSPIVHLLLQIVSIMLAAAIVSFGIAMVYRYAPNRPDAPWRWITPGSAFATLVWLLASFGFSLYVSNFGNYNATYGSLGGVVVFLTWLYLTGYILLMGGELNSELERQQAAQHPLAAPRAAPPPADEAAHFTEREARPPDPLRSRRAEPHPAARASRFAPLALLAGGAAIGAFLHGRRKPPAPRHFHYPSESGPVRA
jgi:membrane protein